MIEANEGEETPGSGRKTGSHRSMQLSTINSDYSESTLNSAVASERSASSRAKNSRPMRQKSVTNYIRKRLKGVATPKWLRNACGHNPSQT